LSGKLGSELSVRTVQFLGEKGRKGKRRVETVTPHFPVLKISLNKSHKSEYFSKRSVTFHLKNNSDNNLSNYKNIQLSSGIKRPHLIIVLA